MEAEKYLHPVEIELGGTMSPYEPEGGVYPQGTGPNYESIQFVPKTESGKIGIQLQVHNGEQLLEFSPRQIRKMVGELNQILYDFHRGENSARPTIDELEQMLNSEEETPITINPDGSITAG